MSKLQLSQTALYEILVDEVESLMKTRDNFNKMHKQVEEQLKRMEALHEEPIPVDVMALQVVHDDISHTLSRGFYVPQWLGKSVVAVLLSLSVSLFFNYRQDVKIREQRYYIEIAEDHIQKLEGKKRK